MAMSNEAEVVPGISLFCMDTTMAPQNDFFNYVNGAWCCGTEIPAERTVWGGYNEIVFPAAILQPPFYNFNAEGNLKNWWTEKDLEKFQELVGRLADQYSAIKGAPDLFINGKFTLGENI
ncbi:MAG: M13-type metalloendopeptidase, partial [Cyclobacteriaceae bacterium]